jgi:hypothetical protein
LSIRETAHRQKCTKPDEPTNAAMPSTHKKEKPWDTDDIDKWKV